MNEERQDTRLITKFPSTYHLRTLFDDYAISDSENSENGDLEEIDVKGELECIIEEGNEDCEDELAVRLVSHGSRSVTEKNETATHVNTARSSLGGSSGSSTNRSKNSRKNKRRSHRK
ncbi:hypothetical protein FG386_002454 [Cryptosporidium ryanae]|uniref:uncharacterized protein n=1 Tax=Cryptosporidium ryanae TaxID=515981 RepID=UPI00351AA484|nr:hypothetical protein FG386_002454 [Cryptosporidium ryanae]